MNVYCYSGAVLFEYMHCVDKTDWMLPALAFAVEMVVIVVLSMFLCGERTIYSFKRAD